MPVDLGHGLFVTRTSEAQSIKKRDITHFKYLASLIFYDKAFFASVVAMRAPKIGGDW